jgi:glycosyltransferase involved in cell wall biosynthesis
MTRIGILAVARQGHGGTLLYTLSMIEALRRLPPDRFRCTVFTAADNHEYDGLGVPVVRLPGSIAVFARRLLGVDPFAAVDKVIAPVYSLKPLASRRPFAFTLHDLQEKHLPENFGVATRVWRHLTNRLLTRRASRVVCESDFVRRDIVRFFGIAEDRIAVIPAPPVTVLRDSRLDEEMLAAVRDKFDLPRCFLFYPAQFWPHKNHRRLVEAFDIVAKAHPECGLVLTGKKRDEYDRVFELVRKLGLTSRVRHIGYVETAELAALYRLATAAVIPTLFESISIPVYEAFSLGTAVCVSDVVALPEQVGDAALLFDPRSAEDMADKVCTLLSDPDLRRQLIERGRRRIAAVNHDDYAAQLTRLFDSLGEATATEPG